MKRATYKAVIYEERDDGSGNLVLKKVTTSQWVTVPQMAATIGVAPQTMYRFIENSGALPFFRFGSLIKVRVDDFLAWLEKCKDAEYERPGAK